jgi:outer membrane scaffolding protein for murein synthesis (MipA/OmpV family)
MVKTKLKVALGALVLIASLGLPGLVIGQETDNAALVPLPSVLDFTRGGGWGVALGAGVEYGTAYDGSDEYELEVEPAGAVQWRTGNHLLFWEGIELGWRSRLASVWLVQAGARYEDGLEPNDSDDGRLDGIEDRDSHIVGFVEVRRALGENWRNWVGGRVMGGEHDFGWLGILAAGHRFGTRTDGTGTEVFVFSTFGTDEFINKDFGVSGAEAASSGLEETDLDGGYRSVGMTLTDRRYLSTHFHIITQAGVELYSEAIQDSPIARNDYETELGVSLLYHF